MQIPGFSGRIHSSACPGPTLLLARWAGKLQPGVRGLVTPEPPHPNFHPDPHLQGEPDPSLPVGVPLLPTCGVSSRQRGQVSSVWEQGTTRSLNTQTMAALRPLRPGLALRTPVPLCCISSSGTSGPRTLFPHQGPVWPLLRYPSTFTIPVERTPPLAAADPRVACGDLSCHREVSRHRECCILDPFQLCWGHSLIKAKHPPNTRGWHSDFTWTGLDQ